MKDLKKIMKKLTYNTIMFILGAISGGLILLLSVFVFVNSSSYVIVPEVKGESKDTAIKALKEIGLIPLIQGIGNKVLYTEPSAGERVKKGRHIFVQLGKIESLKVPDLIGVPVEVAEQFLTSYNLNYKIIKIYNSDEKIETVIDMDPKPGTIVEKRDTILLKISSSEVNK
ncbi:PASTA domain-containing protein [Marinitoga aeolica]|uniref:PASTA domain-containing protein n=1 Tax=Marinitoga aeolica TaxID=2809031 RepID=A0ABY8PNQ2_9BACT|nr:PASTA domain-containing protein [Marinitoga aeolica]WGS64261.1 PASTA domain-containing protein [Marinitoga aeolica]